MKMTRILGLMAASIAAGWILGTWKQGRQFSGETATTSHTGPTIEQVQALSCLVTTRVDVADVVETHLDGYTGGVKAALLVKGDFLLGVDLSQVRFESADNAACTAVLLLPQPRVASPRLDHERTKVFAVSQSGLWQIAPGGGQTSGEVVDQGYRDAQRFVAAACDDPAIIARSRQHAEQMLAAFFAAMGWKVSVRWNDA
jgi:hypothetical protein